MAQDPSTSAPPAVALPKQHLAEVDSRGRLKLPTKATQPVSWFKTGHESANALVVLETPGFLRLLSWEQGGSIVDARRFELIERLEVNAEDVDAIEMLVLLEDKYKTIPISKEARPTLPNEVLLHLGILNAIPCRVYLERVGDELHILSPAYRDKRLKSHGLKLQGLP